MTCKIHLTVGQALLTRSYSDLPLLPACYSGIYTKRTLHCNIPMQRVAVTTPNAPHMPLGQSALIVNQPRCCSLLHQASAVATVSGVVGWAVEATAHPHSRSPCTQRRACPYPCTPPPSPPLNRCGCRPRLWRPPPATAPPASASSSRSAPAAPHTSRRGHRPSQAALQQTLRGLPDLIPCSCHRECCERCCLCVLQVVGCYNQLYWEGMSCAVHFLDINWYLPLLVLGFPCILPSAWSSSLGGWTAIPFHCTLSPSTP